MTDAPRRWLDDPDAPPQLQQDLRAAREADVPFDIDGGLERLQAAIAAAGLPAGGEGHGNPAPGGDGPPSIAPQSTTTSSVAGATAAAGGMTAAAGATGIFSVKIVALVALGVTAAVGVGTYLSQRVEDESAKSSAPVSGSNERSQRADLDHGGPGAAEDGSTPGGTATPRPTAPTPRANTGEASSDNGHYSDNDQRVESGPTGSRDPEARAIVRDRAVEGRQQLTHAEATHATDADAELRRETDELAEARRLLTHDAAAALALVRRGNRDFDGGLFGEERAAIEVFALDRLGRATDARAAGRRFLRRHPSGPFSAEVAQIIEAAHAI